MDLAGRLSHALGDGGSEFRMVAAPMDDGVGGDFVDVGDVLEGQAVAA